MRSLPLVTSMASTCSGDLALVMEASTSLASHANYRLYSDRLTRGWLFGWQLDNDDVQYGPVRDRIPLIAAALIAHALLQQLGGLAIRRWVVRPEQRPMVLAGWRAGLTLLELTVLHGVNVIKIAGLFALYFAISRLPNPTIPFLTWSLTLLCLWGLDSGPYWTIGGWEGLWDRWWTTFKITLLRLVSFNLDVYYAENQEARQAQRHALEKHLGECREACQPLGDGHRCEKGRMLEVSQSSTFLELVGYAGYFPLFLAGPIVTWNSFAWQRRQAAKVALGNILWYAGRLLAILLLFEVIMHRLYMVAIKNARAWEGLSPTELGLLGYWILNTIWLKLMIIWRLFRLGGLLDGLEAPENMGRCMSDHWSMLGFWRAWHRSFNLWITRYLYIPLGGSQWAWLNIWPIFTFVALWHDLEWHLLAWAWLVCAFILLEQTAKALSHRFTWATNYWVQAAAATLNIQLLVIANLTGFALGVEGMKMMLRQIYSARGIFFLLGSYAVLFAMTQVNWEWREEERRRGKHYSY